MSILSVKIAAKLSGAVFASGSRHNFPPQRRARAAAAYARSGGKIRRAGRSKTGRAKRRRAARVLRAAFDSRRSRGIIGTAAML